MSQLNFHRLSNIVQSTFRRFPLAVSSMLLATMAALALSHELSDWEVHQTTQWLKIIFGLAIGLPIHFCFSILNERTQYSSTQKWIVYGLGIALHLGLYFFIQNIAITEEGGIISLLNTLIIAHLLASVVPFLLRFRQTPFWNYNHLLFSTFLSSSFFSAVIYAGLAIAYTAISVLLSNEIISETLYIDTFILIAGIFHTFFFLSKIPSDLPEEIEYPETLTRLNTWILAPLVVIYMAILYLYTAKITFMGKLPEGWVSIWILAFTIVGILTWLLAYPLLAQAQAKRIVQWVRYYFWALIPLLGQLWWAILYRVLQYGITEPRAIILFIAFWLTLVILYVLISNKKTLIFIPTSLLVAAIVYTFGGPISASQWSYRSQLARWQDMMQHPELYTERTISDQLDYLNDWHWDESAEWTALLNCNAPLSNQDDNTYDSRYLRYQSLDSCLFALALKTMEDTSNVLVAAAEPPAVVDLKWDEFEIQGFDFLVNSVNSSNVETNFLFNGDQFEMKLTCNNQDFQIFFTRNEDSRTLDLFTLFSNYVATHQALMNKPSISIKSPLHYSWEDNQYYYSLKFSSISFLNELPVQLYSSSGILLIKKK